MAAGNIEAVSKPRIAKRSKWGSAGKRGIHGSLGAFCGDLQPRGPVYIDAHENRIGYGYENKSQNYRKKIMEFFVGTKIRFGIGSSTGLADLLLSQGLTKVGIVIDRNVRGVLEIEDLVQSVEANGHEVVIDNCTVSEPTYDYLENIRVKFMGSGVKGMIGIGGGSTLDVAKGIAVLVNNKREAIHYRGFDRMTEPVLPIITVPTVGGSGSEITPNASFVDTKEKKKLGINGEAIRPICAIVDPKLSISCPKNPTISAGIDAMVHAVDSFVSTGHTTMSRVLSGEGFKRVFKNLPLVLANPMEVSHRQEIMIGALFAAMGMMNSGGGPTSVLSYPLGVHFGVPHGMAGGIFLPHVVEHNILNGVTDYARLYRLIGDADRSMSDAEQAGEFLLRVQKAWDEYGIPKDITRYGFRKSDTERFVSEAMGMKGGLDGNPIPFYENEIRKILTRLG